MKKAFLKWYNYLIAGILTVVVLAIAFVPAYLYKYSVFGVNSTEWYPEYVILFAAALFLLIGFIWQDLHKANYRRKVKNWDKEIPQEIKDEAWMRCLALFLATACCAIIDFILLFICLSFNITSIFYIL
jgi:hypothetical protein